MFTASPFVERIRQRTIAVTGAGGFIGPWVVRALLDHGANVRSLVGPPGQPARVLQSKHLENIFADIGDVHSLQDLARGADIVVHMAGPPSVAESFNDPGKYARTHTLGTTLILDACRKAGVHKFVYVSSAEVYGRPRTNFVSEDHPIEPRSPYGAAKAAAEQFVRAFALNFGISSIILRPFSVYGPNAPSRGVVATILQMAQS